ncbi:MAG: nucleotidyltransferase domain-containing protein [Candidatus Omnitrophica bacterium]|nr:nucleotidyltransferase domain-containing protein [Candidatus Omnitrophota bacterium]
MDQKELKQLLAELRKGLEVIYGGRLKGFYLFGSYARGEQQKDSDLDILVILNDFERANLEINRTSLLVSRLSLDYAVTITRFFVTEDDWKKSDTSFLANVREDAIAA